MSAVLRRLSGDSRNPLLYTNTPSNPESAVSAAQRRLDVSLDMSAELDAVSIRP